jgi:hypothetical protein
MVWIARALLAAAWKLLRLKPSPPLEPAAEGATLRDSNINGSCSSSSKCTNRDSIQFEEITRVQDAYWKMRSKDAHHTINP